MLLLMHRSNLTLCKFYVIIILYYLKGEAFIVIIFSVDEISKIKEMCGDQADEIILSARNTARDLLRTYSEVQVECEMICGNNIEG